MLRRSSCTDLEYHLGRSRRERELAYRLGDGAAADAHMRLSALHFQRALLLQEVKAHPVGNVRPFKRPSVAPASAAPLPAVEQPSTIR